MKLKQTHASDNVVRGTGSIFEKAVQERICERNKF